MTERPPNPDEDSELERSLERGLHHPPLSPEALARMRAHVYAEFRRQTAGARRQTRNRWFLAIAASLSAVAVSLFLVVTRPSTGDAVAQLAIGSDGAVFAEPGLSGRHRIEPGAILHVSERWEAQGAVLTRLTSGGTLRLSDGTVVVAKDGHTLALERGRLYFDFPRGAGRFVVNTAFGSIEHVGTQFEVMQLDDHLRIRVREGRVLLHAQNDSVPVDSGMEVLMDRAGRIDRSSFPTYGDEWAWVESIAPVFEIENRPLTDFLAWVGRETGRRVTFVDARAREIANHTTLHGSVQGLRPMDALDQVLSTTSLRCEIKGGEIRIASRG